MYNNIGVAYPNKETIVAVKIIRENSPSKFLEDIYLFIPNV